MKKTIHISILVALMLIPASLLQAQHDVLSTQYMNSQLLINPAYAGVRNALSVSLLARQQWMGIKDAPSTYSISAHSPLNKKMASIGASIGHYKAGPYQNNQISAIYAYLLRLNNKLLLSMGMNASAHHFNLGLSSLKLIDVDDPGFMNDVENVIKPNFGIGAFLYGEQFYVGLSVPQILTYDLSEETNGRLVQQITRSYYFSSGYAFNVDKDVFLKPSFMMRYRPDQSSTTDINLQLLWKSKFWIGASYRLNQSMAGLFNLQLGKSMSVAYAYEFPFNKETTIGKGSHEMILTFDIYGPIRRNKNRLFRKKKSTKKDDDKAVQSIRYF